MRKNPSVAMLISINVPISYPPIDGMSFTYAMPESLQSFTSGGLKMLKNLKMLK